MKNEKLIKLLEKMKDTYKSLESAFSNAGDYETALRYQTKDRTMFELLLILKDEKYMNDLLVLYGIDED